MDNKNLRNLELNLGKGCNNRCVFCMSGKVENTLHHLMLPVREAKKEIEKYYKKGCRSLGFLGGEPTIYPYLFDVVRYAKKIGYERISLTTNGRLCDDRAFCEKLIDAGVNRFSVSIHSHEEKTEDAITRVPGNFKRKIKGLKNLVALQKKELIPYGVSINAVISKYNYKNLDEFLSFFKGFGINDIRLNFIRLEGLAEEGIKSGISLRAFKPYIKKIVERNEQKCNINLTFGEMPLCMYSDLMSHGDANVIRKYVGEFFDLSTEVSLKDYDRFRVAEYGKNMIVEQTVGKRFNFQEEKRSVLKEKLPLCGACAMNESCDGIWKNYLDTYRDRSIFKPIFRTKKQQEAAENLPYHLLRVGLACNVACVFCNIPVESGVYPAHLGFARIQKDADAIFKKDARPKISITGGEPTIRADLIDIVAYLKKRGARTIELQTNAVLLADADFVRRLKKAGLDKAFVSLHSHISRIHDLLIMKKGGFEQCMRGIKNLCDQGIEVILNPVVNALTYRNVPEYITFVHKHFPAVRCISLSVVQPNHRALKNKKIIPRYGVISPFIEKALDLADEYDIVVNNPNCGVPLCIGGWYKRPERCLDYNENLAQKKNARKGHPSQAQSKVKPASCGKCAMDAFCNGVWRDYAELYPLTDLIPIRDEKKK